MRSFQNFAVIDWSGEAVAKPKGLAVAHAAAGERAPHLLVPQVGWSRGEILGWLRLLAEAQTDILIGFDLSPSLPFVDLDSYFPGKPGMPLNAKGLWAFIDHICSDDLHLAATSFVRDIELKRHFRQQTECGDLFRPGRGRLRTCEDRQKATGLSPSSCFNLIGAAQVGKSSLTGMRMLHQLGGVIPVWPFDEIPATGPLIVEIYTSIAARAAGVRQGRSKIRDAEGLDDALAALGSEHHAPLARYDDHSTDAILTAAWLRANAARDDLWRPGAMTPMVARTEGWTFGVT